MGTLESGSGEWEGGYPLHAAMIWGGVIVHPGLPCHGEECYWQIRINLPALLLSRSIFYFA